MIVPDIMHENLLGTWKALLLVILRLLYALNPTGVAEFNKRSVFPVFVLPGLSASDRASSDFEVFLPSDVIQSASSRIM